MITPCAVSDLTRVAAWGRGTELRRRFRSTAQIPRLLAWLGAYDKSDKHMKSLPLMLTHKLLNACNMPKIPSPYQHFFLA